MASTYQITDKFAQLDRKLEFMDAAKAHLISAIAAENYTKDFRSQELTESVATLQAIQHNIAELNREQARAEEDAHGDLRKFREMVDQACEEPLMADILFERFTEYKRTQDADRAELQVVMTMSETIEGRIYGMQEKVKNEVLAVMERQVEQRVNSVQDIFRGRIAELRDTLETALDPIRAVDAEDTRAMQDRMAILTTAERDFEERLDAEMAATAESESRAQAARQEVESERRSLRIADDTCAALVAEVFRMLAHRRTMSKAWLRTKILCSAIRNKLSRRSEDLRLTEHKYRELNYDVARQERALEKGKRVISDTQKEAENLAAQITSLTAEKKNAEKESERHMTETVVAAIAAKSKAMEELKEIESRLDGEHSLDVLALHLEDQLNINNLQTAMQNEANRLQQLVDAGKGEIESLKHQISVAQVNIMETAGSHQADVQQLRRTAADVSAGYEGELGDLAQQIQDARSTAKDIQTAHRQKTEKVKSDAITAENALKGKIRELQKQNHEAVEEAHIHKSILEKEIQTAAEKTKNDQDQHAAQLEKLKSDANTAQNEANTAYDNVEKRLDQEKCKLKSETARLGLDLLNAAAKAEEASSAHQAELEAVANRLSKALTEANSRHEEARSQLEQKTRDLEATVTQLEGNLKITTDQAREVLLTHQVALQTIRDECIAVQTDISDQHKETKRQSAETKHHLEVKVLQLEKDVENITGQAEADRKTYLAELQKVKDASEAVQTTVNDANQELQRTQTESIIAYRALRIHTNNLSRAF